MTDLKYTIFSIDNFTVLHTLAKFLRLVDTKQMMGQMEGTMKPLVGSYKGKMEYSFIMRTDDFFKHVANSGYVDKQECIMQVSECNKKYTQLVYPDGETEYLGCMTEAKGLAFLKAYSYDPSQDKYFTVTKGNPDHVRSD